MKFGPVPIADAEGAILAHSVALASGRLKKGRRLNGADIAALAAQGLAEVTVARLAGDDVPEDARQGSRKYMLGCGVKPFVGEGGL